MMALAQETRASRRPKLVIIEGPDGAGKTTLVDMIREEQPRVACFASGVPTRPPLNEYVNTACEGWYTGAPLVVIDRYHIGEQVYGPIMRGKDGLGRTGRDVLESFLSSLYRPVIVLARPPFEVCYNTWSARLDSEYVPDVDRFKAVWEKFGHIDTKLPVVEYDYTRDGQWAKLKRRLFT